MADDLKDTGSSITHAIKAILDKLYNGFLLNDLLSKIIPGSIFLSAINYIGRDGIRFFIIHDFLGSLIVLGLAWATGFTIQAIGEACGLIVSWPREYYTKEGKCKKNWLEKISGHIRNEERINKWYGHYFEFSEFATAAEKEYLSRFPTILNVVNNLSFSVFISTLILLFFQLYKNGYLFSEVNIALFISFITSLLSLLFATKIHRKRLYRFITRTK
jgi:hypothetical protein